uniref:Ig-like domain-containing protein n=1 Tax=Esox lucius TaxID=8010 RepID=A0A3P9A5H9_ESOLU
MIRNGRVLPSMSTEGRTVTLHCELSKPAPSIMWKRGAEILTNVDKYQIRKKDQLVELRIINASLEDSGIYTCICGDQRTTAMLTIKGVLTQEKSQELFFTPFSAKSTTDTAQTSTPAVHPVPASIGPLQPAQTSTPAVHPVLASIGPHHPSDYDTAPDFIEPVEIVTKDQHRSDCYNVLLKCVQCFITIL